MAFKETSLNNCRIWNEFHVFKTTYKIDVHISEKLLTIYIYLIALTQLEYMIIIKDYGKDNFDWLI